MHQTTAVVLLVVVLGQILIFTIAGIAMWLAGEFGEPPQWQAWRKRMARYGMGADAGASAPADRGGLATLRHELPIVPQVQDDKARATDERRPVSGSPLRMTGSR